MVFGMIEFGRAIMVQQILTNASREGARVAILDGGANSSGTQSATAGDVTGTVTTFLSAAGLPASNATITINPSEPSTAAYGAPITVTVQIPYSSVSWLPAPRYFGNVTMSATTIMRRETVQTTTGS
jgi:Flp pilus assembly protein TadG